MAIEQDKLMIGGLGLCFGALVGFVAGVIVMRAQPVEEEHQHAHPPPAARAEGGPEVADPQALQRAIDAHLQAAAADPENVQLLVTLGNLYYEQGNHGEAIPWYQKALARDPSQPKVLSDLAISYFLEGAREQSLETIQEAVRVDPQYATAWLNLAVIHQLGFQDREAALEALARARALDPELAGDPRLDELFKEQG